MSLFGQDTDLSLPPFLAPNTSPNAQQTHDESERRLDVPKLFTLKLLHLALSSDVKQISLLQNVGIQKRDVSHIHSGAYRRSLGQGSFCEVITHEVTIEQAKQASLAPNSAVAIKRYLQGIDATKESRTSNFEAIYHELRRDLAILCHPTLREHENIVKIVFMGWEETNIVPALAFELALYGTLEDFLSGAKPGSVTDVEKLLLTWGIASGLEALHRCGFAHRDIKPTNILVDACPSNGIKAVVADFSGSVTLLRASCSDDRGHITKIWASPEQFSSVDDPSTLDFKKCDVYSFGLLAATLWIQDHHRTGHTIQCFLVHYALAENDEATVDAIDSLKHLPDDDEKSPPCIAYSELSEVLLIGNIISTTLRLNPVDRPQMADIVCQLYLEVPVGQSYESLFDTEPDDNPEFLDEGKAEDASQSTYILLSSLSTFQDNSKDFQQLVIHEMTQIADTILSDIIEVTGNPSTSSDYWNELEALNEQIRNRPYGLHGNRILASLTFDLALCHWLQFGTSPSNLSGLKWLKASAKLGNYLAMSMYTPLRLSLLDQAPGPSHGEALWLTISTMKGFNPSLRWLYEYFPENCKILFGNVKTRFAQDEDNFITNEDISSLPLNLWPEKIEEPPDDIHKRQLAVYEAACRQVEDLNGLQSSLLGGNFQADMPWTNTCFLKPVPQHDTSSWVIPRIEYLIHGLTTHSAKIFDEAMASPLFLPGLESVDIHKSMSVMLSLCLLSYQCPKRLLVYRWGLGAEFRRQHIRQLKSLMKSGANPFIRFENVPSPFLMAAGQSNSDVFHEMVTSASLYAIDLRSWLIENDYVLMHLLEKRCDQGLAFFLANKFFPPNKTIDLGENNIGTDRQYYSLLHISAIGGLVDSIKVLLSQGADVYSIVDRNHLTPFTRALVQDNLEIAKLLLPESREARSRIFNSLSAGGFNCFGTILSGSQAMRGSDGLTMIRRYASLEKFHFLKSLGAPRFIVRPDKNINAFETFFGEGPMLGFGQAFEMLDESIFEFLLEEFHSQLNCRDAKGLPLLHQAVRFGRSSLVLKLLLWKDRGHIDINAGYPKSGGMTALDLAVQKRAHVPKFIMRGGAREIATYHENIRSIVSNLKSYGAIGGENVEAHIWAATFRELSGQRNIHGIYIEPYVDTATLPPQAGDDYLMAQIFRHVLDPGLENASAAADRYVGEWPKRWGVGEDTEDHRPATRDKGKEKALIRHPLLEKVHGEWNELSVQLPKGMNLTTVRTSFKDSETSAILPRVKKDSGRAINDYGPMYRAIEEAFLGQHQDPDDDSPFKIIVSDLRKK